MKVHISFKEMLDKYINEFDEIIGVKLSYCEATKRINKKIEKLGGLKIP